MIQKETHAVVKPLDLTRYTMKKFLSQHSWRRMPLCEPRKGDGLKQLAEEYFTLKPMNLRGAMKAAEYGIGRYLWNKLYTKGLISVSVGVKLIKLLIVMYKDQPPT